MGKKICYGTEQVVTSPYKQGDYIRLQWQHMEEGELFQGLKRPRLTCPKCKRRIVASFRTCDDGCCLTFFIPPHKPKGWWKRKRIPRTKKRR